jgi:hypothetical protein
LCGSRRNIIRSWVVLLVVEEEEEGAHNRASRQQRVRRRGRAGGIERLRGERSQTDRERIRERTK